ncbi:hypothetical protein [Sorangium sp. So ce1389]|uniref:hypothetical protein n=1 Tax=Sorangium sp. So ce1389 TaxID=3133336 RepID=UPI003F60FC4F
MGDERRARSRGSLLLTAPAAAGTEGAASGEDKGDRTGERAEVSLDGIRRVGAVWRDSAPAYRVELKLPHQSAPVTGEPLLDTPGHVRAP